MIRKALLALALGILFTAVSASADTGFGLVLDPSGIDASETASLQSFISSVEAVLPDGLKQGIGRTIRVRFSEMGSGTELALPYCWKPGDEDTADTAKDIDQAKSELLGHDSFDGHASVVDLNSLFKKEILIGPSASRTYACGHHSMYGIAFATLVHELAHVYDADLGKLQSTQSEFFQKLMGFSKQWDGHAFLFRGLGPKNHFYRRSPDPYEYKNIKESFAVNVEYFVMDPEFACRRPTVDHYLRSLMGNPGGPTAQPNCKLNTTIYQDSNNTALNLKLPLNLDPSRIYDVHYLLASKGDSMMSRWGHAMFRIIVCAPDRKTVGPECLQDVQYHMIISYRANVQDVVLSYMKGLDGDYPSQLYVLSLPEILTEYNKLELRDLISLPLGLTEDQKNQFVLRTIEQYWDYQGRYYFLTNNCATESLNFLQGIVPNDKIQKIHDMTPLGLEGDLSKTGMIDESLIQDRNDAISKGYFFASKRPVLDNAFQQISAHIEGLPLKNSDDYMNDTTADQRRGYFDAVMKSTTGDEHTRMAAYFYLLESYISSFDEQRISGKVSNEVEQMLDNADKHPDQQGDIVVGKDMMKALAADQPWNRLSSGYGIPMVADFDQQQAATDDANKTKALKQFTDWMNEQVKDDLAEFKLIEANKLLFRLAIVGESPPPVKI